MSTPARKNDVPGLTETFVRKPFEIEAAQVTEENIKEVAKWCGGKVKTKTENDETQQYILVPVHNPTNDEQRMAFIGKWVLWSRTTAFKVYTERAFRSSFVPKEQPGVAVTDPNANLGRGTSYTKEDAADQLKDYEKPEDSPLHPDHVAHRDAGTGQYVTEEFAEANPKTTVSETSTDEASEEEEEAYS